MFDDKSLWSATGKKKCFEQWPHSSCGECSLLISILAHQHYLGYIFCIYKHKTCETLCCLCNFYMNWSITLRPSLFISLLFLFLSGKPLTFLCVSSSYFNFHRNMINEKLRAGQLFSPYWWILTVTSGFDNHNFTHCYFN